MPEAGPCFRDDDAITGVAWVVAELDGLIDTKTEDAVGEMADILGAVVRDTGQAVAVDKNVGGGRDAVVAGEGTGVEDDAIGDATGKCEVFAAAPLDLVGRGAAQVDDEDDEGDKDNNACGDTAEKAGVVVMQLRGKALEERLQGSSQG